jgi:hypothetical protein
LGKYLVQYFQCDRCRGIHCVRRAFRDFDSHERAATESAHSSYLSTTNVSQMTTTNRQDREIMQKAFYQGPLDIAPCAEKRKKVSDVKYCSVFGLCLGMMLDQTKQIIDRSGYFLEKASFTKIKGCHSDNETCVGYVFATKDGLSISVEFDPSF